MDRSLSHLFVLLSAFLTCTGMDSDTAIPSGIFGQFSYPKHLVISATNKVQWNSLLYIPMPALVLQDLGTGIHPCRVI